MLAIVAALLVLTSGFAYGSESIPREQFKTQFETRMIEGFCKETKFVSHCYDVAPAACQEDVRQSLRKCMQSAALPKEIDSKERARLGTKIGRCTGEDFQARNKSKLRKIPECQNAVEWLGK